MEIEVWEDSRRMFINQGPSFAKRKKHSGEQSMNLL
jgi:hypothetical protein